MANKKEKEETNKKNQQREIYGFDIYQEVSVDEPKKTKDENGEEITVTKKVKKKVPTHFVISKPTRKQIEEADVQFAIKQSEYIKMGILTRAMITKKYADTGGVLTKEEAGYLTGLYKELSELQNRFVQLTVNVKDKNKEQEKESEDVINRLNEIRKEIAEIESSYSNLFQHTADVKASNWVILWYSLMLTYTEDENSGEWTPYFEGETFEDKLNFYYEKEENPDDMYIELRQKLSYFISFWYNGAVSSKEDFESLEKDIESGEV